MTEAVIEGALIDVCPSCVTYGREVPIERAAFQKTSTPRAVESAIVAGYGSILRDAREKAGFTREQLAKKLFIREQDLAKFEAEQLKPSESDARKLGQFLKIVLLSSVDALGAEKEAALKRKTPTGRGFTLADVVEIKKS